MFRSFTFCIRKSVILKKRIFDLQRMSPITSNVKTLDTKPTNIKSLQGTDKMKYIPLYQFKPIQIISAIGRVKMQQLGLTILTIPITLTLTEMEYCEPGTMYGTAFVGFSIFNILCTISFVFRNTIAMIYVSEDEKTLKVVSCNFKGQRIDTIIDSSDWVFFSDLPELKVLSKFYLPVRTCDDRHKWKMFLSAGKIFDVELFTKILGDPNFGFAKK